MDDHAGGPRRVGFLADTHTVGLCLNDLSDSAPRVDLVTIVPAG